MCEGNTAASTQAHTAPMRDGLQMHNSACTASECELTQCLKQYLQHERKTSSRLQVCSCYNVFLFKNSAVFAGLLLSQRAILVSSNSTTRSGSVMLQPHFPVLTLRLLQGDTVTTYNIFIARALDMPLSPHLHTTGKSCVAPDGFSGPHDTATTLTRAHHDTTLSGL